MEKTCKYCSVIITELNGAKKKNRCGNYYFRNECKPCRVKINSKYKKLSIKEKQVLCETCFKPCIKGFNRAFCSLMCRFMSYVNKTENCWLWIGGKDRYGYGELIVNNVADQKAHRVSYELYKGLIPNSMLILHSCHNRLCVNPEHLRIGTVVDNNRDMVERGTQVMGEKVASSKLTENAIIEIRKLYETGEYSQQNLADIYGVSQYNISCIIRKKWWKHIN